MQFIAINFDDISNTFGIKSKEELLELIENSSPSMLEYQTKLMAEELGTSDYVDLAFVEEQFKIGEHNILIDYDKKYYVVLEDEKNDNNKSTLTY